jgi:hypothetical protein
VAASTHGCAFNDGVELKYRATGWMIGDRFLAEIFLFTKTFIPAVRPTQPHIQWVLGDISSGVKLPERVTSNSFPSSAEIKKARIYIATIPINTFIERRLLKVKDTGRGVG